MKRRSIDFRLYTPDFNKALEIFQIIEKFPEGYSPQLSTVVNVGWNVSCYVTQSDAEFLCGNFQNKPEIGNKGHSCEIWTFDFLDIMRKW